MKIVADARQIPARGASAGDAAIPQNRVCVPQRTNQVTLTQESSSGAESRLVEICRGGKAAVEEVEEYEGSNTAIATNKDCDAPVFVAAEGAAPAGF